MRVSAVRSGDELNRAASEHVKDVVRAAPTLNVVFPTGRTPIGLYQSLRSEHAAGRFSLDDAHVFMLDEYVDLPSAPEGSFQSFLRAHLGELVFNDRTVFHPIPSEDNPQSCEKYDRELDMAGGVDLAVVGIGRNGHVGFNEPGARPDERTHVVSLAETTLATNFPNLAPSKRPTRAVTMGLRDLLGATSVLMLVSGTTKFPILTKLREGEVDPLVPATYLSAHRDFTVIADEAALRGV